LRWLRARGPARGAGGLLLLLAACTGFDLAAARRAGARGDCVAVERALRSAEQRAPLSGEREAVAVLLRAQCLEEADRLADAAEYYRYLVERHATTPAAREAARGLERIPPPRAARVEPAPRDRPTRRGEASLDLGRPSPVRRHFTDFGPPETLRLCLLREPGVSETRVRRVVEGLRGGLALYGITLEVPRVERWSPPPDGPGTRIAALHGLQIEAPCDRLLALSSLRTREFLTRSVSPSRPGATIEGEVESRAFSRGYAFVRPISVFHVFGFDAVALALHEVHHLLRCGHDVVMDDCYRQIARLKRAARESRARGLDFFPILTRDGVWIRERSAVSALPEPPSAPASERTSVGPREEAR